MAKGKKSSFNIQDAYAAQQGAPADQSQQAPAPDADSAPEQGLTIPPDQVEQLEQLKQQGDQSGDYSALGKAFADILTQSEGSEQ
jgi:hypothetical protein